MDELQRLGCEVASSFQSRCSGVVAVTALPGLPGDRTAACSGQATWPRPARFGHQITPSVAVAGAGAGADAVAAAATAATAAAAAAAAAVVLLSL